MRPDVKQPKSSNMSLLRIKSICKPSILKSARFNSTWANVTQGPPDPILGVTQAYLEDKNPLKINLGVGAYRDDSGKPWVLPSVKKSQKIIAGEQRDLEYAPISGTQNFTKLASELAYGKNCQALQNGRIAIVQSLSGTGALRIGAEFIRKFWLPLNPDAKVYVPSPTWGNHHAIFKDAGLKVDTYRYYDAATRGLDFDGMCKDLEKMKDGQVILLHACAQNPTGVDVHPNQMAKLSELCARHLVFFDMAYQGFASGNVDKDAEFMRLFVKDGHNILLAQSFAKNMGLYGERVGTLSVVCPDEETKKRVESQLKIIIRPMYSSPPLSGARIATEILGREDLFNDWSHEILTMANRIISMRQLLFSHLVHTYQSKLSWDHITNQIGMFCYTGLSPEQVERMRHEFSVYMTKDGRISIAGITSGNVEYLARAIHEVTKDA